MNWHYNKKTGTFGECHAQPGNCPVGDCEHHFTSKIDMNYYMDGLNSRTTLYDNPEKYNTAYLVGAKDNLLAKIEGEGYTVRRTAKGGITSSRIEETEFFCEQIEKEELSEIEKKEITRVYFDSIGEYTKDEMRFPIYRLANIYPKGEMVPQNVQNIINKNVDKMNVINKDIRLYNGIERYLRSTRESAEDEYIPF